MHSISNLIRKQFGDVPIITKETIEQQKKSKAYFDNIYKPQMYRIPTARVRSISSKLFNKRLYGEMVKIISLFTFDQACICARLCKHIYKLKKILQYPCLHYILTNSQLWTVIWLWNDLQSALSLHAISL